MHVSQGDHPFRSSAAPLFGALVLGLAGAEVQAQSLLSQGRPAVSSSNEGSAYPAGNAVDGSAATRWSSQFSDPQWIHVDLGATHSISRVVLSWEAAYGSAYQLQVSDDAGTWTTIHSTTGGAGGVNDLDVSGSGRYVRFYGTQRGTVYGYSLWELQVYGSPGGQQPFGGTPRPVPGTIQAEDYDTGGEGTAYHDTTAGNSGGQHRGDGVDIEAATDAGGGFDVGWTGPGEWLEYTVDVAAAGAYDLGVRVASLSAGGTLHLELDGEDVSGAVSFGATGGWQAWTTVTRPGVPLAAGRRVLRLALDSGGFNVNWLRLTPAAGAQQPFGGVAWPVPGTIQAENYDTGGEGVAHHDTTAGNSGGQYRADGVDVEATTDAGGGYDVGWSAAGEWLEYTADVAATASYTLGVRVASLAAGGTLHVEVDGQDVTGPVSFPATGGWQGWTTVTRPGVTLAAGRRVVRLAMDAGGFNVNWIGFSPPGACTTLPGVPTGLSSPAQTDGSVTLAWNASPPGANCTVQYRVFLNGSQATQVSTTGATIGGLAAGTAYSFSVGAINEHGSSAPSAPIAVTTTGGVVDFGPNVLVFDPSMSASAIQSQIDGVYAIQQGNHFGDTRHALLFKPGSYAVNVPVGFSTQVLGLGRSPDDVSVATIRSDAFLGGNNATQNFWRGVENFATGSPGGSLQWAVSQAVPFRRMHVRGNLVLHQNGGWGSGGWISDSRIDGNVDSGPQQQWISRNAQWGSWTGSNWNMVFVGVVNAPAGSWPSPAYTKVGQTPIVREKPYLYLDGSQYAVFVPSLRTNSQGTSWASGPTPGTSIPIGQFHVARSGTDTAASLNAALAQGKHLLLTPGAYELNEPIRVTRAGTVVLGLGFATLRAVTGQAAMTVADVDGVVLAGLLFDAGGTSSPVLLEVGPPGSSASHSASPTSLHDVFVRVGGAGVGRAGVSVRVNSHHVIGDHLWLWRADHGSGVGWTSNTAATGLVVNGDDVTLYGLFVEHYQQYQTIWNGNRGRTYFYQSELPYDPPNQASWTSGGGVDGWASYKVAGSVTSHEAWGLGVYGVFFNPGVDLANAIESPTNGAARFHSMVTVSIIANGEITHIVNGAGGTATPNVGNVPRLTSYP